LSLLTGEIPRTVERGAALAAIALPELPFLLPSEQLRRRPDIPQPEQQLVAATARSTPHAAFMPAVQLGTSGGFVAAELIDDPIAIFSLGGSLLAPIF